MGMCCYLTPARGVTTFGLTPLHTCLIPGVELFPGHFFANKGLMLLYLTRERLCSDGLSLRSEAPLNSEPTFSYQSPPLKTPCPLDLGMKAAFLLGRDESGE